MVSPAGALASIATMEEGRGTGWLVAGRYEVGERIGRGAFGSVFRAWHCTLRAEVALKLVPASEASPASIERLLREGRRMFSLRAPTLVRALDAGWDPAYGAFYLAMDLVEGEPLARRLARLGPRPPAEVTRVVEDLSLALSTLHRAGVVHRDVTPANVVAQTDGRGRLTRAVLVDLGSSWRPGESRLTGDGLLIGSNGYVAPELVMSGRVSPAVDQYALGCIAHELAQGERPFEADHPLALLARHATAERPLARNLPVAAARAVQRAMAVEPEERFESVDRFAAALRRAERRAERRERPERRTADRPGLARATRRRDRGTRKKGIAR